MSSTAGDLSGKKKKHVHFARMREEEEDDNPEQEEEEEDTLFDKRKAVKAGLKSALKRGKRLVHSATGENVEIKRDGGACSRCFITLTLCASFLGLVIPLTLPLITQYQSQHMYSDMQCIFKSHYRFLIQT